AVTIASHAVPVLVDDGPAPVARLEAVVPDPASVRAEAERPLGRERLDAPIRGDGRGRLRDLSPLVVARIAPPGTRLRPRDERAAIVGRLRDRVDRRVRQTAAVVEPGAAAVLRPEDG